MAKFKNLAVKEFANPDLHRDAKLITYDMLGLREVEKKLAKDSILFWLFIALVITITFTMYPFTRGIQPF